MTKTLHYEFTTESHYLEATDEIEDYGEDFYFEVDENEILNALPYIIYDMYFDGKEMRDFQSFFSQAIKGLKDFIRDNDYMLMQLAEDYEEQLKDYFREEAYYEYKN
jgi:hypothetical protein